MEKTEEPATSSKLSDVLSRAEKALRGEGYGTQVKNGFRTAGWVLFTITTVFLLLGGITAICFPNTIEPYSFLRHSPGIGWIFLAVSTVILIVMMDRWVKILPGIIGYAIVGALIALETGHYGHLPVPRGQALIALLFLSVVTALSLTFQKRTLNVVDRIALLTFVFCLVFGMASEGVR
jgi:hypothetical protein